MAAVRREPACSLNTSSCGRVHAEEPGTTFRMCVPRSSRFGCTQTGTRKFRHRHTQHLLAPASRAAAGAARRRRPISRRSGADCANGAARGRGRRSWRSPTVAPAGRAGSARGVWRRAEWVDCAATTVSAVARAIRRRSSSDQPRGNPTSAPPAAARRVPACAAIATRAWSSSAGSAPDLMALARQPRRRHRRTRPTSRTSGTRRAGPLETGGGTRPKVLEPCGQPAGDRNARGLRGTPR
jgi:hypothetical protein